VSVKVAQTDAEKLACFPVMKELRTHLEEAEFMPQLERQEAQGYRLAFVEKNGQVVAAAGFWVNEAFAYGRYMYVYDLVTSERARSGGHGRALLEFLKALARDAGCAQLHLDSGVQRFRAHRFYLREGFVISGHHFQLVL
jgi:GNAT superfamily N-acetyltransferase